MKFLLETLSCYTIILTPEGRTFSLSFFFFFLLWEGMLVKSSHPIIQSERTLLGASPTMHLLTSLTHLHSQFTAHAFNILSPSRPPLKSPHNDLFSLLCSIEYNAGPLVHRISPGCSNFILKSTRYTNTLKESVVAVV